MKINTLFAKCLKQSETACKEQGKSASVRRKDDEFILLFHLDNDEFRNAFNLRRSKTCDNLFFYLKDAKPQTASLVFVELKGSKVEDAIGQLEVTIQAFRSQLNSST